MNIFSIRSMTKRALVAYLLLMITSLTVSGVHAEMIYTYTYEGPTFEEYVENNGGFPASPVIGDSITINFSSPVALPDGTRIIEAFTIACGDLSLTEENANYDARVTVSSGNIVDWDFSVTEGFYEMHSKFDIYAGYDSVIYHNTGTGAMGYFNVAFTAPEGWTQSAVPVPASGLLLGSGLIPLAWFRRSKRWGK